jgi:hypothetical protein
MQNLSLHISSHTCHMALLNNFLYASSGMWWIEFESSYGKFVLTVSSNPHEVHFKWSEFDLLMTMVSFRHIILCNIILQYHRSKWHILIIKSINQHKVSLSLVLKMAFLALVCGFLYMSSGEPSSSPAIANSFRLSSSPAIVNSFWLSSNPQGVSFQVVRVWIHVQSTMWWCEFEFTCNPLCGGPGSSPLQYILTINTLCWSPDYHSVLNAHFFF